MSRLAATVADLTARMENYQRGKGTQDILWDAFQSTIEPDRWYVSNGRAAVLATERGVSGQAEAELVAAMFNALPALLFDITLRAHKS
jgi:hypothetical protein